VSADKSQIDDKHIEWVENDIIETINPIGNIKRSTPPHDLQTHTHEIIKTLRTVIHENRGTKFTLNKHRRTA
jgi:hypothetical protein